MSIRKQSYNTLWILLLVLMLFFTVPLHAQRKSNAFFSRHRAEIRAGSGFMYDAIPLNLNYGKVLQVPSGEFAYGGGINYKFFFTPRFAVGYQFDYYHFIGKIFEGNSEVGKAGTNAFGNSLTLGYYFRSMVQENYRFNYNINYKLGTIAINLAGGDVEREDVSQAVILSDVGIGMLTSLGVGVNYLINEQLSLIWTFDYNHIHNSTGNLHRLDRLFSVTPYTVSRYPISSIGLTYRFKNRDKIQLEENLPFYGGN